MATFSNTDTGSKPADPYKAANKDEVSLDEKIMALDKFVKSTKFGLLTTHDTESKRLVTRAMAVAAQESGGIDLLFFTNTESNKTNELKSDPHVNVGFLDSSGQWASFSGTTNIETDRSIIKKHYSPALKAWMGDLGDGKHDGSAEDPRIGIIRVKTDSVTYAVTDQTFIGRSIEVAKGAVTGQPAAVNKLRELSNTEIQSWRSSH